MMNFTKTAMIVSPYASRFLRARVIVGLTLALGTVPTHALAAAYPDHTITFILGFGTGGPTDIIARTLADQLTKEFGERVIVENKTGASGNIATQVVADARADGYTYLVAALPLAVNESLFPNSKVKFGRDIVAVAPIGANSNVLVVRKSLNVHTLAEFVERARSKPNAVTYAMFGPGSSSHLAGVAFDLRIGATMLPIGYRSGSAALLDVLGGRVDAWFAPIPSVLGAVKAGQLVALATTGTERSILLPQVPTMEESGFKGFTIRLWVGIFARKGVPAHAMHTMEHAISRAMASEQMKTVLERQGITPLAMSRAAFSKFVHLEIRRWKKVVAAFKK